MSRLSIALLVAAMVLASAGILRAAEKTEHPYMLWDREDIKRLRAMYENEPWMKESLARLEASRGRPVAELFRYAVLGETDRLQTEKKRLLSVARSKAPRGAAQWVTVLRYDLLYDKLTPAERAEVEAFFRTYIKLQVFDRAVFDPKVFNDERNYSRYDAKKYTRSNWLPNIIWPWKVSANLMAAALGDEKLIRKTWAAYGSWKWYFDEYLGDIGFYEEEFSKMGSTPGAMIVYCEALERLGLGELGYGYDGTGGATMRGHLASLIHLATPAVDLHTDRPRYPLVTMGDLRQAGSSAKMDMPTPAFQHALVEGFLPGGIGGNTRWLAHGAWGGVKRGNHPQWDGYSNFTPKMQIPLWFELGHKRWPEDGFGYFLAAMRTPDRDAYLPSPLFGIKPVAAARVNPPPAPSAVWPDRGLVMLRADESPAYWTGPAPAACMRLASPYAHHCNDPFALLGLFAFNRAIYLNRQTWPGYSRGWSRTAQSHASLVVDGGEPKFTTKTRTRHHFDGPARMVTAASDDVWPGVHLVRSLVLTDSYLVDVVHVASDEPHDYAWFVHALGVEEGVGDWPEAEWPEGLEKVDEARSPGTIDTGWDVTIVQCPAIDDAEELKLPARWYEREVGVTLRMLGAEGTRPFVARTPWPIRSRRNEEGEKVRTTVQPEVGGRTVMAHRRAKTTTFVALHEPFEGGEGRIAEFKEMGRTDRGIALRVKGEDGLRHVICLAFADASEEPVTIEHGGDKATFSGQVFMRLKDKDTIEASGDLRRLDTSAPADAKLILNGRPVDTEYADGHLIYEAKKDSK